MSVRRSPPPRRIPEVLAHELMVATGLLSRALSIAASAHLSSCALTQLPLELHTRMHSGYF